PTPPRDLHSFPTRRSSDLLIALAVALAKELSGQAHFERAQETAKVGDHCQTDPGGSVAQQEASHCKTDQQLYAEMTDKRFNGVRSEEHTSELQSLAYLVCR